MAMPQCCYLAKGAKRPSHTTNTIKFDRIPFDPCNSIKRFDLCPFDQKNSTYLQPPASKKRKYEQRIINVENSSFSPLVFATTGGAGPSASKIITRLAAKLSDKTSEPYADVVSFIRTKVSFALLRSSILCIRGCRSLKRTVIQTESSMSAIVEEGRLSSSQ